MRGLRGPHMFIGLMLIPPIALKLASTGYRFARYYTGAPVYVAKGPPQLGLRALAPLLVATTVMIFVTGVWLLILGHRSDQVLMLHKVAFIVWSGVFGVHFLVHLPRVGRSLRTAWELRRVAPPPHARTRRHGGARRGVALRRARARVRAAAAHRRLAPRLRLLSPRTASIERKAAELQAFCVVGETGFEPATARPPARGTPFCSVLDCAISRAFLLSVLLGFAQFVP